MLQSAVRHCGGDWCGAALMLRARVVWLRVARGGWAARGCTHLDLAHGSRDEGLEHGAAPVVEQVNFIDNEQTHELGVGALAALARDDVPLLGGGHDDLRRVDLALGQVYVARQLAHLRRVHGAKG